MINILRIKDPSLTQNFRGQKETRIVSYISNLLQIHHRLCFMLTSKPALQLTKINMLSPREPCGGGNFT